MVAGGCRALCTTQNYMMYDDGNGECVV